MLSWKFLSKPLWRTHILTEVRGLQSSTLQKELPQVRFSVYFQNNYFWKPYLNGLVIKRSTDSTTSTTSGQTNNQTDTKSGQANTYKETDEYYA